MPIAPVPVPDEDAGSRRLQTLAALVDNVGAYVYTKDAEGRYLFASEPWCRLLGTPLHELIGETDERFLDLERSAAAVEHDRRVLRDGAEIQAQEEIVLRGGEARLLWCVKVPIRDAVGGIAGLCGFFADITHRQRVADHLIERNQLLGTILSNVEACVYVKDHDGRYAYANEPALAVFGRGVAEVVGRTDVELLGPEAGNRIAQFDHLVLDLSMRQAREELLVGADGLEHRFWSVKMPLSLPGLPPGLIGFSTDITELMRLQENLERHRTTDALTGLPNRLQFEDELAAELRTAQREQFGLAVVLFDIDQFKVLNTSLGHQAGDRLLRHVASRLLQCSATLGALGRVTGDQFVLSLPRIAAPEDAATLVARLRARLAQPYQVDDRPFHLTVSAGIALYPEDADNATALFAHAESAMYLAKESGRDQASFYSRELSEAMDARLELERDLRAAVVAAQGFELHYQPKIRREDEGVAGFEALLRWRRNGQGLASPAQFVPLAEQLGLLVPVGSWAIREACRQMAQWREAGFGQVPVAVNLSISQLTHPELTDFVSRCLKDFDIADDLLELEVTESMMMSDPEQAIAILESLGRLGVRLAIDDFGTGYSSMAYLKRLPVDTLKLDRVFVTNVDTDSTDADLCAGVIALAHKLGLDVVAEGVETAPQRDALAQRECDYYQGYLYGRPLQVEQATRFLRQYPPRRGGALSARH
jgi:diguanylate cyclase (GGDEF)-like protein/PAS domain S-box-containing protein